MSLTKEQRQEVGEIINASNALLIEQIKSTMHEIIDPLKDAVNLSNNNHTALETKVFESERRTNDNRKSIEKLDDELRDRDKNMIGICKDIDRITSDINGLGQKLRGNEVNDKEKSDKIERLEDDVNRAKGAVKMLTIIGSCIGVVLTILVAVIGLG